MKPSLYKVGDRVKIVKKDNKVDYPFGFTNVMAFYEGCVFEISKIEEFTEDWDKYEYKRCINTNGDIHKYTLKRIKGEDYTVKNILFKPEIFIWHSSMFEPKESNVMEQKTIVIDGIEYTCTPKEQPKKWRDNVDNIISGYFIDDASEIVNITIEEENPNEDYNYNVFATEKQAKSALAMARISQIIANDFRFGGVITDKEWQDASITKYIICRWGNKIQTDFGYTSHHFLAFRTKEQRNLFLKENEDLVKDYLMLD